jgi:hypothetical protein
VDDIAPSIYEGRADTRERAYEALETVGRNAIANLRARKLALELLEWMAMPGKATDGATGDRANSSCQAAKDAAKRVAKSLNLEP